MNSVFEANSFVVKLARVYPPEAAPKATRAVLGNLFEEALAMSCELLWNESVGVHSFLVRHSLGEVGSVS